ncbi:MAG: OmpA family protein [Planctomycetota bacterium]|jgi:OOP family OmpA-OmpF porin|nr:OmpA family protein [Planctomycetota bacterium]
MADLDAMSSASPEHPGTAPPVSGEASRGDRVAAAAGPERPPPPEDPELRRLRELIFAREIAQIDQARDFFENPRVATRKVSEVLAEAIHLRSSNKDPHLSMALEPVVDAIVKTSFGARRNEFVNALSPLMGPTIRKSIAESFRSMMGSFSKSMEMAFSWKGLRWRFAALRSGKPFSEIVMLNTLVYRVEQLFFIHSDTGLVLSYVADESVKSQDADMVSAMLTAIQDFVRDCFATGKDESLHSLHMGEFTIHIESGARAYLACVMRGTPPPDFHAQLRATLELMHVEYDDALENFQGDTAPFAGAVRYLESCLLSHYADGGKKISLLAKVLLAAIPLGLAAGLGYLHQARERAAAEQAGIAAKRDAFMASMRGALGYLRAEPGLIVASVVEAAEAPWEVVALKDALARPPGEVLRGEGVDPALFSIRIIPFMSYDPSIVVRRIKEAIRPPDTVSMVFDGQGLLTFTGTAPMSWIVAVREDARAIPGVERVDMSGVRDPMLERITSMIAEVESTVIEFPLGRDTPRPADLPKLKKTIDTLVELENITRGMGFSASLTIYGHADAQGDDRRNYEISQARARTVAGMLYARGSSMPVAIYGMGSEYPRGGGPSGREAAGRDSQASRRIELRLNFALSPSARPEMFRR